jgi:hypothetical protein
MSSRGITAPHVWYCIVHHDKEYKVENDEITYVTKLPDGRNLKVRVRDGSRDPIYIIDTFSFK